MSIITKSKSNNYVELKSAAPTLVVWCPVCGELAIDAGSCDCCGGLYINHEVGCPHVLFICGFQRDDCELVYSQPRLTNTLQALAEEQLEPRQFACQLNLDADRALVMIVSTQISACEGEDGVVVVVGFEFPPAPATVAVAKPS
jgi:hypothetical protein